MKLSSEVKATSIRTNEMKGLLKESFEETKPLIKQINDKLDQEIQKHDISDKIWNELIKHELENT
jgi:hypothetical protein